VTTQTPINTKSKPIYSIKSAATPTTKHNLLKIGHINVRSLRKKYFLLKHLLDKENYDILCITESLLKPFHLIADFPGYNMIRSDIQKKGQRGVAVIYKTELKTSHYILKYDDLSNNLELISIKVQSSYFKSFIISCVYRHPLYTKQTLSNDLESLDYVYKDFLSSNLNFLSLGDFNLRDHHIKPLLDNLDQLNLEQLIDKPTRQQNKLDLMITNAVSFVSKVRVYEPFLSDHCLTDCAFNIRKPPCDKKVIQLRPYKSIDPAKIKCDLESYPLPDPFLNSDDQLINVMNIISDTFDKHAQVIVKKVPIRDHKISVSDSTKKLIKKRDLLYRANKRKPSLSTKTQLTRMKTRVKFCIYNDTKYSLDAKIRATNIWKGLNQIYPLKPKKSMDSHFTPEEVNDYFVSISMPCLGNDHQQRGTSVDPDLIMEIDDQDKFALAYISNADIRNIWKKMKKTQVTSTDPMEISPRMIDISLNSDRFTHYLSCMYNKFISSGYIPPILKTAKVIPIPKINSPTSCNDLRPIALQPVLIKIFEKCIQSQLSYYVNTMNILSPCQFGFRKMHSTSHALSTIMDYIYKEVDVGNICILLALDLKKAFDKVDRAVLLSKMARYGINVKVIEALISDRRQFVYMNSNGTSCCSNTKLTKLGVAQGSCISCLFFTLLINDLPNHVKNSMTVMFADDTSLVISGKPEELFSIICKLEDDLSSVNSWMNVNNLELNESKTQMLVVAKPNILKKLGDVSVKINCFPVARVKQLKILGVILDDKLDFILHAKDVSKKCYAALFSLFPLKRLLSYESRLKLINSQVISILDYAFLVWSNGSKQVSNIVNRIIRMAARFIFDKNKFDPVLHEINYNLEWLMCKYRFQFEALKFAFKVMHNLVPDNFKNYFNTDNVNLRTTRNSSYKTPVSNANSKWGEQSLHVTAYQLWLNIPETISTCNSFPRFKKLAYSFILTKQINELEPNLHDIKNCQKDCQQCALLLIDLIDD